MQRRKRNTVADIRGNSLHILLRQSRKPIQILQKPGLALLKNLRSRSILHPFNKRIHLFGLDSCQVIADTHIKLEPIHCPQSKLFRHHLAGKPCLHVLIKCLGNVEFGGPFYIVALVIGFNTGLGNREILTVKNLHRL